MNVINNTINRLQYIVAECPVMIKSIPEEEFSNKPSRGKWSKKELLGHLCDSGINNLSRFVRAQFEPQPFKLLKYEQDEWVKFNYYHDDSTENVLNFWIILNKRIIEVIKKIPEDTLGRQCALGDLKEDETKSLLWLIEDYLAHMEYHLKQIIGDEFKSTAKYPQN